MQESMTSFQSISWENNEAKGIQFHKVIWDAQLKLHAQPTTPAPSQHIPHQPTHPNPLPSPELTLSCMPLHHLHATYPLHRRFINNRVWDISQGNLTNGLQAWNITGHPIRITPLVTNHRRCYKRPWEYTQSPAFFNTTSHQHQTKSPTASNHYSMRACHVKAFSNIRSDLLSCIVKIPPPTRPPSRTLKIP